MSDVALNRDADGTVRPYRDGDAPQPGNPPAGPRALYPDALLDALSESQKPNLSLVKDSDRWRFTARREPYPENNPLVARVAKVLGTTPAAWFDAALKPPQA